MSWGFTFKGKRERVIEAVKAWTPPSSMVEEEKTQTAQAKDLAVAEAERHTGADFISVNANGSYYTTGTPPKAHSFLRVEVQAAENYLL